MSPSAATPTTEARLMSGETRVDVLAVFDELVNHLWNPFEPDNQDEKYKIVVTARASVVELIEAAMAVVVDDQARGLFDINVSKLAAVLARIGAKP